MLLKFEKIKRNIENEFQNSSEDIDFLDFVKIKSYDIIKSSNLFDADFYLSEYPDVKFSNYDPIKHYLELGAFEYCNPNNQFNSKEYLNKHQIDLNLINPLVHYILYGFSEIDLNNNLIDSLAEKYFVSIIMVIGEGDDVSNSINSVFNQSFKNFELLIASDNDFNLNNFIKYRDDYSHIIEKISHYFIEENNISNIRNKLLAKSKGNVIAYIDSNGSWSNNFLEEMLSFFEKHDDVNCAYSNVKVINYLNNAQYILKNKFDRNLLLEHNFIELTSFIHFRELYEMFSGFDEELLELYDWDLIIRFTDNNFPGHIEKTLVNLYVDSEDNFYSDDEKTLIFNKFWVEKYESEYNYIKDDFDQGYYLEEYEDVLKSNLHPMFHFLYKGYKENKNPNMNFNMGDYKEKYKEIFSKNDINPFIHYISQKNNECIQSNSNCNYSDVINSNLIYLSDYSFNISPLVSIIILSNNDLFNLEILFKNFNKNTNYNNYEILVMYSEMDEKSINYLSTFDENIKFIKVENSISSSKCYNHAVNFAKGEYILFIDSYIKPTYGWLNEMLGTILIDKQIGAVGAKLIYPMFEDENKSKYSLSLCHAGQLICEKMNENGPYFIYNKDEFSKNIFDSSISINKQVFSVSNYLFLTKKDLFQDMGGFNEEFTPDFSTIDYNLKLYKENYKVMLSSAALAFYSGDIPKMSDVFCENFNEVWGDFLFKRLIYDKITKNFFFTDKKLKFIFVLTKNIKENSEFKKIIHCLSLYLNDHDYDVSFKFDSCDFYIKEDVDILVSFSNEYDLNSIDARKNLIKILILNEFNSIIDDNWDILLVSKKDSYTKFKKCFVDFPIFYISDLMELGKDIVNILMKTY